MVYLSKKKQMTTLTKQITCEHIDQLFTSDDGFDDLFVNSDVEGQNEFDSLNRPSSQPLPSFVSHPDIVPTSNPRSYREKESPTSCHSSKGHKKRERTLFSRIVTSVVLISLLWIGVFAWSKSNSSPSPQLTPISFQPKQLPTQYVTKNIEDLSLGDRVLGRNPEVSDANRALFGPEPTPETYLGYFLALPKENDTMTFVELLRPYDWLSDEIVEVVELENEEGDLEETVLVWLELPEMGTVGWAELLEDFQLDEFESGTGNLVIGTFCHLAPETIDLVIEGIDPIGCTPNHPFWSVDRKAYIDAGELFDGERILLYSGETKRIVQKLARPGPEIVYNIEVFGEHVYHVTAVGVLVHNQYEKTNTKSKLPPEVTGPIDSMRTPAEVRQARNYFKNNRAEAIRRYEERTGLKWDKENIPFAEHPVPLKDGGDPLHIEPGVGKPNDAHSVVRPDGLTDAQRWGKMGGRPKNP